jgi:hypothetical protein
VGGTTVEIEGEREDIEGLDLRRLTQRELTTLLRDQRANYARLKKRQTKGL